MYDFVKINEKTQERFVCKCDSPYCSKFAKYVNRKPSLNGPNYLCEHCYSELVELLNA